MGCNSPRPWQLIYRVLKFNAEVAVEVLTTYQNPSSPKRRQHLPNRQLLTWRPLLLYLLSECCQETTISRTFRVYTKTGVDAMLDPIKELGMVLRTCPQHRLEPHTATTTSPPPEAPNLHGSRGKVPQQDEGANVELALGKLAGERVYQAQLLLEKVREEPLQQLEHGVPDGLVRRFPRRVPDELEVDVRQLVEPRQIPRDVSGSVTREKTGRHTGLGPLQRVDCCCFSSTARKKLTSTTRRCTCATDSLITLGSESNVPCHDDRVDYGLINLPIVAHVLG